MPLFSRYQIESQIETAFEHEVKLQSGGSVVIDPTEALVSIDINSARATKGADIEETALNTNLEAADEIARQLRLRDVGGLIVIDFIDMVAAKNQRAVEARMAEALQADRARVQIGKISRFGLMEMSRQRLRPSLEELTTEICPRCTGQGRIRDIESLALSILRVVEEECLKERSSMVRARVPLSVGAYLLNEKRREVADIESRTDTHVVVVPAMDLETPQYNIQRIREDTAETEVSVPSYEFTAPTPTELPEVREARPVKVQEAAVKVVQGAPPTPKAAPELPVAAEETGDKTGKLSRMLRSVKVNLFGGESAPVEQDDKDKTKTKTATGSRARRQRGGRKPAGAAADLAERTTRRPQGGERSRRAEGQGQTEPRGEGRSRRRRGRRDDEGRSGSEDGRSSGPNAEASADNQRSSGSNESGERRRSGGERRGERRRDDQAARGGGAARGRGRDARDKPRDGEDQAAGARPPVGESRRKPRRDRASISSGSQPPGRSPSAETGDARLEIGAQSPDNLDEHKPIHEKQPTAATGSPAEERDGSPPAPQAAPASSASRASNDPRGSSRRKSRGSRRPRAEAASEPTQANRCGDDERQRRRGTVEARSRSSPLAGRSRIGRSRTGRSRRTRGCRNGLGGSRRVARGGRTTRSGGDRVPGSGRTGHGGSRRVPGSGRTGRGSSRRAASRHGASG